MFDDLGMVQEIRIGCFQEVGIILVRNLNMPSLDGGMNESRLEL